MTYDVKARHILQHGHPTEKAVVLVNVSYWKEVPDDIVELIDKLRQDRSVARMYAPFRYGELGFLATKVYALIRYRRGFKEPVTIEKTVSPLRGEDLSRLCEKHGVEFDSDDPVDWFIALKKRGLLNVEDEFFDERSFDLDE
jgi:hypothetical protein